ncbi:hypothetical protein ACHAXR_011840 [Thalassiosira sp. AJA248-18]
MNGNAKESGFANHRVGEAALRGGANANTDDDGGNSAEADNEGYGPGPSDVIDDQEPRCRKGEFVRGTNGHGPGAHPVAGSVPADGPTLADYEGQSTATAAAAAAARPECSDEHGVDDNGDIILEGFVAEPTREEILDEAAERLIESSITLDPSAVRKIRDSDSDDDVRPSTSITECMGDSHAEDVTPNSNDVDVAQDDGGATISRWEEFRKTYFRSPFGIGVLTGLVVLAIVLAVSFGSNNSASSSICTGSASVAGDVNDRYTHAKSIVSKITPLDTLRNASSPQYEALQWIVCEDEISSKLIDEKDPSTNILPTQMHGFISGGDSGEAQVLRRYTLATFYFSTSSIDMPWIDKWNFLSPDVHECSWHQNITRENWPWGGFDPAGLVCTHPTRSSEGGFHEIMLNDRETYIGKVFWNFRISNNLSGTIPPEFGYLEDMNEITMENQKQMIGSIPSTIGNMVNLYSLSFQFFGPGFGGLIPSSLFSIPALEWITLYGHEGMFEFPPSIETTGVENKIAGVFIRFSGLAGTIPQFLSEFQNLLQIDFEGNSLQGDVPDSFAGLKYLDYLNLYDNNLNGTLPQSLGQIANLTGMTLGKNDFQGPIPSSLGNLSKLRLLDLSYNKLEGPIPATFSQLTSLEHVSLQHNAHLNGSVSAFEGLPLSNLLLYSNSFSSTIPAGLFSNSTHGNNIFADFGHNNFTGKIPEIFSEKASNTSYLSIMKNKFDADSVEDVICDEVQTLFADCNSCRCCQFCCAENSAEESSQTSDPCNFDLDFHTLSGLNMGSWWKVKWDA